MISTVSTTSSVVWDSETPRRERRSQYTLNPALDNSMTLDQAKVNHPASTGRSTTIADKATAAVRNDHGSTRAVNRSRRSSRRRRS